MSEKELREAFRAALESYEAAKARRGDTVSAFVELLATERALISHGTAVHPIAGKAEWGA